MIETKFMNTFLKILRVSKSINFDVLKEIVNERLFDNYRPAIDLKYKRMIPITDRDVYTIPQTKKLGMVYDMRVVVLPDLPSMLYGFNKLLII